MDSLVLYKGEQDISDDVGTRNGKSNPSGWSQHELYLKSTGESIGWLENGDPDLNEGYTFKIMPLEEYEKIRNERVE